MTITTLHNSQIVPFIANTQTTISNAIWLTNSSGTNYPSPTVSTQNGNTGVVAYPLMVNDYDWVVNNADTTIRAILATKGVELNDGGILKIVDGTPVVEYSHKDGSNVRKIHSGVIDLKTGGKYNLGPGTVFRAPDGSIFEIGPDGKVTKDSFVSAHEKVIHLDIGSHVLYESLAFCNFHDIHIPNGLHTKAKFTLPDGLVLTVEPDGTTTIDDTNAKTIYKSAPVRDFNAYLNASDLLEEFIAYCGTQNISQEDFSKIPVSLFIYWLIVRAAEADGDSTEEITPLLTTAIRERKIHSHRCKCCGKFLTKKYEVNSVSFCSPDHMNRFMKRM